VIDVEQAVLNYKIRSELDSMGMSFDSKWHDYLYFTYTAIGELASYHPPTAEHALRVGRLMGIVVWLSGGVWEEVKQGYVAGFLHDIGKLDVDRTVLDKPANEGFTEEDYRKMRIHVTTRSAEVDYVARLSTVEEWWKPVCMAMMGHHLRPDGRGYGPGGLQTPGQQVHIMDLTMKVHFCDYLDATGRNDRLENVGKDEQTLLDEAIFWLKEEGFDPYEVEKMRRVAEKAKTLDIGRSDLVLPSIQREIEKNLFG
jgi:response regulator RpfG family c-di-GMP phosphodiesterase